MIGLVLVNFTWHQGPVAGWQTIFVYMLLIVGVMILGAFLYVEAKVSGFSLAPLREVKETLVLCLVASLRDGLPSESGSTTSSRCSRLCVVTPSCCQLCRCRLALSQGLVRPLPQAFSSADFSQAGSC